MCCGMPDGLARCQDAWLGRPRVFWQLHERQSRNKYHEHNEYGRYFQTQRNPGKNKSVKVSITRRCSQQYSSLFLLCPDLLHIYILIFALLRKSLFYLAPLEGTMTIWCFLAPHFKEARVAVCWLFDIREIVLDNSADECRKRSVVPKCLKIFQVKIQSHHDHNGPFFPLPKK